MLSQLSYTPIKPEIREANFVLELRFKKRAMLQRMFFRSESREACGASFSFLASSNRRFDIARKGVRHLRRLFCSSFQTTLLEYGKYLVFKCSAQWRTSLLRSIQIFDLNRLSKKSRAKKLRFSLARSRFENMCVESSHMFVLETRVRFPLRGNLALWA